MGTSNKGDRWIDRLDSVAVLSHLATEDQRWGLAKLKRALLQEPHLSGFHTLGFRKKSQHSDYTLDMLS